MSPNRVFLGWERPALDSIVSYFVENFLHQNELDLGKVLLVFSNARAGRRILEKFAILAAKDHIVLTPPRVITVGAFPETLYEPTFPIATPYETLLAWGEALKGIERSELEKITGVYPDTDSPSHWMPTAKQIQGLYSELSAELLSFSEAAKKISKMDRPYEDVRWGILSHAFDRYVEILASHALVDRDQARREAIRDQKIQSDYQVFFCAVRDVSTMVRHFLESLSNPATLFIFAPEDQSESFDEYGGVIVEKWTSRPLHLRDNQIQVAHDLHDMGIAALKALSELGGGVHQSEIAIGQTDARLIPELAAVFQGVGLTLHDPAGKPISDSPPIVFLTECAKLIRSVSMRECLTLFRLPEVEAYIRTSLLETNALSVDSLLHELDRYQIDHLQGSIRELPSISNERDTVVVAAVDSLKALFAPFLQGKRPLDVWIPEVEKLLQTLYQLGAGYQDEYDIIQNAWETFSRIPKKLIPFVSGSEALALLVEAVVDASVPVLRDETAIESLGWLELQLEDVPAIIVCGMNERLVPESVNSDTYLPESVRCELGLLDNAKRFARDAFVLESLANSVPNLTCIYARYDKEGTPLLPSRLLLATTEDRYLHRVKKLYSDLPPKRILEERTLEVSKGVQWEIPPKPKIPKGGISALSVTSFKSYLQCPYRFYLRHIRSLERIDDEQFEMDGATFGKLGHAVVARYISTSAAMTTDAEKHRGTISNILDEEFTKVFGNHPLPAVLIQREQLRLRLLLCAERTAHWRAEGWITEKVEYAPSQKASTIEIDREPIRIVGRIDRIDYHPKEKCWAVFDYKFSDMSISPEDAHRDKNGWKDLQLPLYKFLLDRDGFNGSFKLGYISMSSQIQEEPYQFVDWSDDVIKEAIESAYTIVRKVRKGEFLPPSDSLSFDDDFAPILGKSQFYEIGGEDAF